MKIHELSRLSGVNPETIRMYRQRGLLHPLRQENGYFDYSSYNLYELMFVRKLRNANLGLENISDFYTEEKHLDAIKSMAQEINALDEAIRDLERRKKQLLSTLGHYVLFPNRSQPVRQKLRSECWFLPLELEPADGACRKWLEHPDILFTGIRVEPSYLEHPEPTVPYTLVLGAYTEDLKRLKLPIPPQAHRMPYGHYLVSFLEVGMDGVIDGSQLQPLTDYASTHNEHFCDGQGAFLYRLKETPSGTRMVFCFQARVEAQT